MCGLFSSVFQKIISYNTSPIFKEVGGVIQPLIFEQYEVSSIFKIQFQKLVPLSFFDFRDSISEASVVFEVQFQKLV